MPDVELMGLVRHNMRKTKSNLEAFEMLCDPYAKLLKDIDFLIVAFDWCEDRTSDQELIAGAEILQEMKQAKSYQEAFRILCSRARESKLITDQEILQIAYQYSKGELLKDEAIRR